MPDVKTFYPGATAGNPINNATDAALATTATTATTATVGNSIDDQNQTPNALPCKTTMTYSRALRRSLKRTQCI